MNVPPLMGSERRRAPAAGSPARRPRFPAATRPRPHTPPEPLEPRRLLATFTVTTTADAGPGSLRQAILDATAAAGADQIQFAIVNEPGAARTIRPLAALPAIPASTTIDATTQPGYAGQPVIEIDGSAAAVEPSDGLTIVGPGVRVRGLAINRFSGNGISVRDTAVAPAPEVAVRIEANHIGTNAAGDAALPNGRSGILINATGVVVGGEPVFGNVISGNERYGIEAGRSAGVLDISFNRLGTNAAGDTALLHQDTGAFVTAGTATLRRNVISGNRSNGVFITLGATASIRGCFVGTDVTGTRAIPNGVQGWEGTGGVECIGGARVTIGPDTPSDDPGQAVPSVVSGNFSYGVMISHGGTGVVTAHVGVDVTGTAPLPNRGFGVQVYWSQGAEVVNSIIAHNDSDGVRSFESDFVLVDRNRIERNGGSGVRVLAIYYDSAPYPFTTTIRSNSISGNGGIGIDLGNLREGGTTPNDELDTDRGPNELQNFPTITGVSNDGRLAAITVRLDSQPLRTYRAELFSSDALEGGGGGGGERSLGFIDLTTDIGGRAFGTLTVPATSLGLRSRITATATDTDGNTSEFSAAVSALRGRPVFRPATRPQPRVATPPTAAALVWSEERTLASLRAVLH
jgi:hypothetical protein